MAGTLDFNPREAPPQELKDVFKLWKGQLTPERDQFLNENVGNMPRLDSIPCHRLVENFNRFSGHSDDASETDVINQVALNSYGSVYSSQDVPGMNLFIKQSQ
jgi:alkylated DNA repair protein alkB family protein 1